jgi:hypothetical protein
VHEQLAQAGVAQRAAQQGARDELRPGTDDGGDVNAR